jgi:tRNA threonylcarbamoyladenosine biosynthesis protein TsaB
VSVGPGSFTGLRVGIVCAKTLAYATGCRLAAVDTMEAIAANSPPDVKVVQVIADAQRGDVYVGAYERGVDGVWRRESPLVILKADSWRAGLRIGEVVTGPGLAVIEDGPASGWRRLPQTTWIPSARTVAMIGQRQIERGILADCATLEPLYVRRSAAEEKAQQART